MGRTLLIIIAGIGLGLGLGWFLFQPHTEEGNAGERKILYYRDPMNPSYTSPEPGKAPDGMDLVPVYAEEGNTGSGEGERKIAYYQCPMHPLYTSDKPGDCPICGMRLVPAYEGGGAGTENVAGIKIDPVTVQNIGVRMEEVTKRKMEKKIRAVGKVDYDETKVFSINTKIMGWVEKLHVDYTGKFVRKGEPLLDLYSPELVSTQEEYLQAIRYRERLKASSIEAARAGATEMVESAKRRLLYWDIPDDAIKALEERGVPEKTMAFHAPVDGIVMEKMVFQGQNVMSGMELYKIADLSTVWILADIYQFDLPWVKVGQMVDVELSYLPGRAYKGRITYIYPYLSMETKTAKVRVEVRNTRNFDLKPDMFATVTINSPVALEAVAVPDQAIIRSGERTIAVMALGGGYFDPREVKLGVTADGYVQILEGIMEGEKIVTSSQFLIDSESNLKAAIGLMAGHAGHDMSKPMEQEGKVSGAHEGHGMEEMPKEVTDKEHQGHEMKEKDTSGSDKPEKAQLYTCEMHPEVISDKPGDCPKCGMRLIPKKD